MPSILIEVCFVDSTADAAIYDSKFDQICEAIATVLGGKERVIGV
jgi:N-acetylmuramoyl-L-alanine amidase